MIKKIVSSLVIGLIITFFMGHNDDWLHQKILSIYLEVIQKTLDCHVSFTIYSLNFFSPSCTLLDVKFTSTEKDTWSWGCTRCSLHASWIGLLFKGVLEYHLVIENFECFSHIRSDGSLMIDSYIESFMKESFIPFPVLFKSIIFKNASLTICSDDTKVIKLAFNSSSFATKDQMKTMFSVYDGTISWNNTVYGHGIIADISMTSSFQDNFFKYRATGSGIVQLSHMKEDGACYILGSYECGRGRFSLYNAYNSFLVDPMVITEDEIKLSGSAPLSYFVRCLSNDPDRNDIEGTIKYSGRILKNSIKGCVMLEEATVDHRKICDSTKIIFAKNNSHWESTIDVKKLHQEFKGNGFWDDNMRQGRYTLYNTTFIGFMPYWHIAPYQFQLKGRLNDSQIAGVLTTKISHRLSQASHVLQGGFSYDGEKGEISALLDNSQLQLSCMVNPGFSLTNCSYHDNEERPLVSLREVPEEKGIMDGYVSFTLMREFINSFFNYDVQGEGTFDVKMGIKERTVFADITLADATIRLPETYNFINGFKARLLCDIDQKRIILNNVNVSLYTGSFSSLRMTALFDKDGKLIFAHTPILLNHCLFNIKKDLFAMVSGSLLLSQNIGDKPRVTGALIIDRAQLKENIFSTVIQKRLFDYTNSAFSFSDFAIGCDLIIETKSPIKVDTPFLQTSAQVNLSIKRDAIDPIVSGSIVLYGGNLVFPYKSLLISKGLVTFCPGQLLDPSVELHAYNKVKKYDVSLQLLGSLLNHHIMLDSKPCLSEEQIMTLLLVGSEDSSLNSMVPSLIVQNLKKLILTNNQATFFDKYFAPLLRSFTISLIPSFIDQSGRGGLRGVLEINVNDRCRASIQKNFTLTEDTRFDLEFLLSDDITLRGIRDERRDIGGEIEMKWKF